MNIPWVYIVVLILLKQIELLYDIIIIIILSYRYLFTHLYAPVQKRSNFKHITISYIIKYYF